MVLLHPQSFYLHTRKTNDASNPTRCSQPAFEQSNQCEYFEVECKVDDGYGRTETFETGAGNLIFGFCLAPLMARIRLPLITPMLAFLLASIVNAVAIPDAQGWNGPGWYITGSAPIASQPVAAPDYILFEGPHALLTDCKEAYDRLYSPVGICRFLGAKPQSFIKTPSNPLDP